LVHCKPLRRDFAVQILIPDGGTFELGSERFDAPMRYKVPYRLIDEAAALARPCHPVNGLNRGFGQDDVEAFAHGKGV
jgi:hypothetical protein